MKSLRYLNTVLTVIAILLTLNVYVQLTGTPGGGVVSVAQEARADAPKRGVGSSATAQLNELKEINDNLSRLAGKLTDGTMRVKVDSIPDRGD